MGDPQPKTVFGIIQTSIDIPVDIFGNPDFLRFDKRDESWELDKVEITVDLTVQGELHWPDAEVEDQYEVRVLTIAPDHDVVFQTYNASSEEGTRFWNSGKGWATAVVATTDRLEFGHFPPEVQEHFKDGLIELLDPLYEDPDELDDLDEELEPGEALRLEGMAAVGALQEAHRWAAEIENTSLQNEIQRTLQEVRKLQAVMAVEAPVEESTDLDGIEATLERD